MSLRNLLARRHFVTATVAAAATLAMPSIASAQVQGAYPNRTVRIVLGFPPGTAPDLVARVVAQKMQETLGQPTVVENKPGGGGLIAAQSVYNAAPDGYTLFLNTVTDMSIAPFMYSKLTYDPNEFELISHIVYADTVFVVPTKIPARNLNEYVAWAKQQKTLFLATFGPGSPAHFGTTIFGNAFGLTTEPVHFKTATDAMNGVLSGDVPGVFGTAAFVSPFIKDGRVRALAATSPQRLAMLPDVPTFKELGHPEATFASWFGLAAPPKTPRAVVDVLVAATQKAVQSPEVRQKLESSGFRVTGTNREEFAQIVRDETALWGKAVKASGFKAD